MNKSQKKSYRIGCYIRVSTEEQAENPEGSIKNQEERLRQTVKLKNMEGHFGEIVEVFIDRARSGKDTNRPALQKMLNAIRNREIDLVMASELSRISRSIKDFAEIWELMQEHDCSFQSLRENFDTTTAAGEMVLYTMANIAQFERRQVSERVSANFQARAARGLYNGGTVPLGYKIIEGKPGFLEVDPEGAEYVRKAFRAFLKHKSLNQTAKHLNEHGPHLPRRVEGGGRPRMPHLLFDGLQHILRNKAYVGVRVFKVKGVIKETKAVWEPIVDETLFTRVQDLLTKNYSRKKPHSKTRYPYILSGITVCADCGHRLSGKSAHGRNGKIAYYEHAWITKSQGQLNKKFYPCEHHRILASKVEPVVWQETKKFLTNGKMLTEMISEAREYKARQKKGSEREKLKAKVSTLNSQLEALAERLSLIPKSVSPAPVFKQMEKLEGLKSELESQLATIIENGPDEMPVNLEVIHQFRETLGALLDRENDPQVKEHIISKTIDRVSITKDGVDVEFIVGKNHYSRELALAGSHRNLGSNQIKQGKRSEPLPRFLKDSGSNTLTFGGPDRDRTCDLKHAMLPLSQLSYRPT